MVAHLLGGDGELREAVGGGRVEAGVLHRHAVGKRDGVGVVVVVGLYALVVDRDLGGVLVGERGNTHGELVGDVVDGGLELRGASPSGAAQHHLLELAESEAALEVLLEELRRHSVLAQQHLVALKAEGAAFVLERRVAADLRAHVLVGCLKLGALRHGERGGVLPCAAVDLGGWGLVVAPAAEAAHVVHQTVEERARQVLAAKLAG